MGRFAVRRLLQAVPVVLGATFVIFAATYALPGDPVRALAGDRPMLESEYQAIVEAHNLDDPLLVQYGKYLTGLVQGDMGTSLAVRRGRDVSAIIADTFPVTLRLAAVAFLFEVVVGVAAGVAAGLRSGSFVDNLVRLSTIAVVAIPVFMVGLAAQLVLGVRLGWLPVAGTSQGWISYLLPGVVLGSLGLAYVARITRTSVVENLRADHVRTATAKGLSRRRVLTRHVLRNAAIPVVTFLAVDFGALMGGAVVIEGIFNLGGVGGAVFAGVRTQDGPVVVGVVSILVLVYVLGSTLVDLLYGVLDPRIRHG